MSKKYKILNIKLKNYFKVFVRIDECRNVRAVDCAILERWCSESYLGFESRFLRHIYKMNYATIKSARRSD